MIESALCTVWATCCSHSTFASASRKMLFLLQSVSVLLLQPLNWYNCRLFTFLLFVFLATVLQTQTLLQTLFAFLCDPLASPTRWPLTECRHEQRMLGVKTQCTSSCWCNTFSWSNGRLLHATANASVNRVADRADRRETRGTACLEDVWEGRGKKERKRERESLDEASRKGRQRLGRERNRSMRT